MSSVEFAKAQGYEYPQFEDISDLARTSRVDTEMNLGWMRANPELAVESIANFFNRHPEDQFDHSVQPRYVSPSRSPILPEEKFMHLGYVQLTAVRKKG